MEDFNNRKTSKTMKSDQPKEEVDESTVCQVRVRRGKRIDGGGKVPFILAPWAADVQDDYKDTNGEEGEFEEPYNFYGMRFGYNVGYGHLWGGNLDVDHTDVFEVYGRFALNDIFAITGDVQYMKDSMNIGESPNGWIFGLRATAEF